MATTLKNKKTVVFCIACRPWLKKLRADDRVVIRCNKSKKPASDESVQKLVKGADVIVSALNPIGAKIMDAAGEQLKLIAKFSASFDHIDIKEASARGIAVTNTPEVSSTAVAEFTMSLILSVAKRIAKQTNSRAMGATNFGTTPYAWLPLAGKTLGIIGSGNIGLCCKKLLPRAGYENLILRYKKKR